MAPFQLVKKTREFVLSQTASISLFSFILFSSLALLSSCGYHLTDFSQEKTVSIPYIQGDYDGRFTNELALQLASSGGYKVVQNNGRYLCKVAIIDDEKERVDFRFDRDDVSGCLEKNLIPTASRRNVTAEVTLIDTYTNKTVAGPFIAKESAEYDYVDPSSLEDVSFINSCCKREAVICFSLGQLASVDDAACNALSPLYSRLSQKIVSALLFHQESSYSENEREIFQDK